MTVLAPFIVPYGLGALLWILWAVLMFRSGRKAIAVWVSSALVVFMTYFWLDEGVETGKTELGTVIECVPGGRRVGPSCTVEIEGGSIGIRVSDLLRPGDRVLLAQYRRGLTDREFYVLKRTVSP